MLAIIPARGGSKGVPGKNIRHLAGIPLIHWTIKAALASTKITRVIISTDDKNIADICKLYNVEIPFLRPSELAQDDSLAIDNYIYTVERLNKEYNAEISEFCVLLPTVPFRNSEDIDCAIELFWKKEADSVISCTNLQHPAEWIFSVSDDMKIEQNLESTKKKLINRQSIKPQYIPNGAIYIFKYELLKEKYNYYSNNSYAYVMPKERSVDIDTEFDFKFAEFISGEFTEVVDNG